MRGLRDIDYNKIVAYLGNTADSDFEKRRNRKEYDQMIDRVEAIRQEPVYRWPMPRKEIIRRSP